VSKRQKIAVDDCHFLATALHPLYGSRFLEPEELGKAVSAMESIGKRLNLPLDILHKEFSEFQRRSGRYAIDALMRPISCMSAAAWWMTYHPDTNFAQGNTFINNLRDQNGYIFLF
jgi:arylamine N-acetyltransferase